jgi:hypothetical protein
LQRRVLPFPDSGSGPKPAKRALIVHTGRAKGASKVEGLDEFPNQITKRFYLRRLCWDRDRFEKIIYIRGILRVYALGILERGLQCKFRKFYGKM